MNEELQKQLAEVVRRSMELAEKTGQFVLDEAPDLIQKFIMWHTVKWGLLILLGVVLCFSLKYFSWLGSKKEPDVSRWEKTNILGRWFQGESVVPVFIFGSVGSITGLICAIIGIYHFCFITVAPKIYIIEYFLK